MKRKYLYPMLSSLPLLFTMFTYQQCSRTCPVNASVAAPPTSGNETQISNNTPTCSDNNSVLCINDLKSCGTHPNQSIWSEVQTGKDITTTVTCSDGTSINNTYQSLADFRCDNGMVTTVKDNYQGAAIQINNCPQSPQNCGNHLNNEIWFSVALDQLFKIAKSCGQNFFDYYQVENEMKCLNGQEVPTGKTQNTLLVKSDPCPVDPAPIPTPTSTSTTTTTPTTSSLDCGLHLNGATWAVGDGTLSEPNACGFSIYQMNHTYSCQNGAVIDSGIICKGALISASTCPTPVVTTTNNNNCQNHLDGSVWSEVVANDNFSVINKCEDSKNSSSLVYQKVATYLCSNQKISLLKIEKGSLLSFTNCLPKKCKRHRHGSTYIEDEDDNDDGEYHTEKRCDDGKEIETGLKIKKERS